MADDNVPLAALQGQGPPRARGGRGRGRGAKLPRSGHEVKGPRPRGNPETEEFLRDCVIGYIETEEDPVQSGNPKERESEEIKRLAKELGPEEVPITKKARNTFVWVAKAQGQKRHTRVMYTTNADKLLMAPHFESGNTCDICGADCTEELYEFRCYKRAVRVRGHNKADVDGGDRKLHPFISYISKECGRGLLGVATPASKFVAQLSDIVAADDAVDQLHRLFQFASSHEQQLIQNKLRYIARMEAGESERFAEYDRAERRFGKLERAPKDPFRAVARSFSGTVSSWDLAAATITRAKEKNILPTDGWIAEVAQALQEGLPLPAAPQSWFKLRAMEGLQLLSQCWPVRIVVSEMLGRDVAFEPEGEAVASVSLVWVCMELHSYVSATDQVSKDAANSFKKELKESLAVCTERFSTGKNAAVGSKGLRGARSEDAAIVMPEGKVEDEFMLQTLRSITWPCCFSRANVRPDGALFISAFPMGIVQNYFSGLMMSVTSRIWPNLARVLNKYVADRFPDFRWTTIQLNRNYSAKLHIDANNLGPSLIVALGEFEEGGLWIMEEGGTVPMKIQEPLRGFANLKVGDEIFGKIKEVRNTFLEFDGTLPHMACGYKGKERYSLVFFTRRGWLGQRRCDPQAKEKLEALGFRVPEEDYVAKHAPKAFAGTGIKIHIKKKGEKAAEQSAEAELDEEIDEVDEEERFDRALEMQLEGPHWRGHEWAQRFLEQLGLAWDVPSLGAGGRPILLSTFEAGAVPALALEQLLPAGMLKQVVMTETRPESIRFARLNGTPEAIFSDVAAVSKGEGVCEIQHCSVPVPKITDEAEDIYVGAICLEPFKVHEKGAASKQFNVENDSRAIPFKMQRKHIAERKPCIALLTVTDYGDMKKSDEAAALQFILKGKRGEEAWGLQLLPDYGVEVVDLESNKFGVPVAQTTAFVLLVRADCGGGRACQHASRLARDVLSRVLAPCTVHEMLFDDSDARLSKVVGRSAAEYLRDPTESKFAVERKVKAAAKALGVKVHDEAYVSHLQGQFGAEYVQKAWIANASKGQLQCLNMAFGIAKQRGMDVDNFLVDMSTEARILQENLWRDDGKMAAPSSRAGWPAVHYSFAKHRPLAGQEELGCRGYVLPRLYLSGLSDRHLRILANGVPVPVMGAMLCAALAASQLPERQLGMPAQAIENSLANLPNPPEQALSAAIFSKEGKKAPETTGEDSLLEGRAAALLSMMKHGKFGQEEVGVAAKGRKPKDKEQMDGILKSLKEVSKEEGDVECDPLHAADAMAKRERLLDEPRPWHERLRKIRHANPKPEPEAVYRWIHQAADDSCSKNAEAIVTEGFQNLCSQLKGGGGTLPMPQACKDGREVFETAIRDAGFVQFALPFWEILESTLLEEQLHLTQGRKSILLQDPAEMVQYVDTELGAFTTWSTRRTFIRHLVQVIKAVNEKDRNRDSNRLLRGFAEAGGFDEVAKFLREAPDEVDDPDWLEAGSDLEILRTAPLKTYGHHALQMAPAVHHIAGRFANAKLKTNLVNRVEQMLITEASQIMNHKDCFDCVSRSKGVPAELERLREHSSMAVERVKAHCSIGGATGKRLELTVEIMEAAFASDVDDENLPAEHWRKELVKNDERADRRPPARGGLWEAVAKAEDRLIGLHRSRCQDHAMKAAERESKRMQMSMMQEAQRQSEEHFLQAQQDAELIRRLAEDGRLIDDSTEGVEELKRARASLERHKRQIRDDRARSEDFKEALGLAAEALKRYANRHINEARVAVLKLLGDDGSLREATEQGMFSMHNALWQLKDATGHLRPAERIEVDSAIQRGLEAARRCAGLPEARTRAASILVRNKCGAFVELMSAKNLLTTLGSLRMQGEARLEGSSLPPRVRKELVKLAHRSNWSEEHFHPRAAEEPPSFQKHVSQQSGMQYFVYLPTGASYWMWPDRAQTQIPPQESDFAEPPAPEVRGFQKPGTAAYLEWSSTTGDGICHLCNDQGSAHFKSAKHKIARRDWDKLVDALAAVKQGFTDDPNNLGGAEIWGLARAWRFELFHVCSNAGVLPSRTAMLPLFWARVVSPHLPRESTALALERAFERMLEVARLPEPSFAASMPKPPQDFPCYPPQTVATCGLSADLPEAAVESFTLMDLLGEGVELASEGQYRCGFCDYTFEEAKLRHHLHPHYKEAKKHDANQALVRRVTKMFQKDGWRLAHNGIRIVNQLYHCDPCGKSAPWYEYPEHILTNAHKAKWPPPSFTKEEEDEYGSAWMTDMTEALDAHLESLVSNTQVTMELRRRRKSLEEAEAAASKKRAAEAAAKAESPPKRARPAATEEPNDGPGTATPPASAAPAVVPVLPVPGKDFLWLPRGENWVQEKDGRKFCRICDEPVADGQDHEVTARHKRNIKCHEHFIAMLRTSGWLHRREGMEIKDMRIRCNVCNVDKVWYDMPEEHWTSKGHLKWRRQVVGELPAETADDPERMAWNKMFEDLDSDTAQPPDGAQQVLASKTPASPSPSRKQARASSPKRPRVASPRARGSASIYYEGSSATSSSSLAAGACSSSAAGTSKGLPRPPAAAREYRDEPSAGSIQNATTKAGNLWVPKLPHPSLVFGYHKKPWLWVWCQACKEWVTLVRFNFSEEVAATDDGECQHWTPAVADQFRQSMQDEIRRWSR